MRSTVNSPAFPKKYTHLDQDKAFTEDNDDAVNITYSIYLETLKLTVCRGFAVFQVFFFFLLRLLRPKMFDFVVAI